MGLKAEHDGRGEGYGSYHGLTIAEIEEIYARCVEDPTMRSISAILRIAREQLNARGGLGVYPVLATIAAVACIASLGARGVVPSNYVETATKAAIGSGVVFLLLLLSVIPTSKTRRQNLAQEQAICDATTRAIVKILESNPPLKPLTYEQEFTVSLLLKKSAGSEPLRKMTKT